MNRTSLVLSMLMAVGCSGADGAAGAAGASGSAGPAGTNGLPGDPGENGDIGATGDAGPQGDPGDPGGPPGPMGDSGPQGETGEAGLPGSGGVVWVDTNGDVVPGVFGFPTPVYFDESGYIWNFNSLTGVASADRITSQYFTAVDCAGSASFDINEASVPRRVYRFRSETTFALVDSPQATSIAACSVETLFCSNLDSGSCGAVNVYGPSEMVTGMVAPLIPNTPLHAELP